MPLPASRAQAIAACLSSAGFEPRLEREAGCIRVEVDTPGSPSAASWRALLAAVDRGDRFGLTSNREGSTVWALIYTSGPSGPPSSAVGSCET